MENEKSYSTIQEGILNCILKKYCTDAANFGSVSICKYTTKRNLFLFGLLHQGTTRPLSQ